MDLDKHRKPPFMYALCLHSTCARSGDCLRHQAALRIENTTVQQVYFTPVYILSIEGDCPHYQPDTTARFAIGVTHLYDKLTHTQEKKIRHALIRRFRRSPYYRIYRKEKLLKPVDIEFIRQLFIREGIAEEPLFDEYVNLPDWQE